MVATRRPVIERTTHQHKQPPLQHPKTTRKGRDLLIPAYDLKESSNDLYITHHQFCSLSPFDMYSTSYMHKKVNLCESGNIKDLCWVTIGQEI